MFLQQSVRLFWFLHDPQALETAIPFPFHQTMFLSRQGVAAQQVFGAATQLLRPSGWHLQSVVPPG